MINYLIQVLLFQAVLLAVYDFFLHKETFFKWNRFYLLIAPFLSFIIPFLKVESIQKSAAQDYLIQLPTVFLNPQNVIGQSENSLIVLDFLKIIFYVGMLILLSIFFVKLFKILTLISSNRVVKKENYNLVLLENKHSAFSFFNYIFIHKDLLENNSFNVIQHELVHCKQKHTLDLLLFELLKIVFWFNPFIYIFQKRITLLHEYISDAEVVKETDKTQYFNKLLSETFSVENITFINEFYKQSLIKKRIKMITKEKSRNIKQLKYLFVVPLLIAMLFYSSCSEKAQSDTINIEKSNKNDEEEFKNKQVAGSAEDDSVPFSNVDEIPVFPGCEGTKEELKKCFQEGIMEHVGNNFNSKKAKGLDLEPGIKRIFVMFKIDSEGNIADVEAKAPHQILADEAIRVVSSLPKMKPGKHLGKNVGVKYSLPIAFKVESEEGNLKNENGSQPIYILNGKEISEIEMKQLKSSDIERIDVLKDKSAMEKYGEKGKNGVIIITSKVQ